MLSMPAPKDEKAATFRRDLLEILKQLNRSEEEETEVPGVETSELLLHLKRGPCPDLTEADLETQIGTLLANRMACEIDDTRYAWDRGRTVGRRFALTTEGKEFLLQNLERSGRIG